MGSLFADETAVERDPAAGPRGAGGRYHATIGEAWNLRPIPQGGIVSAIALRAMTAELEDPGQRLRTLHTTFAAQVTTARCTWTSRSCVGDGRCRTCGPRW